MARRGPAPLSDARYHRAIQCLQKVALRTKRTCEALEALVVPVIEATVHVAGLAQSFSRTRLAPISVLVPDEEDEKCQQLNHIDTNRPSM